eukprot:TRINITY_DN93678_c0_g1_i1.p1 TRINITY_DN93678_c0_g1~~TRINITY_DN93678_c0_g1_i1.p1  ORF type:complete len:275 (+),score=40.87 TRINITY_DN93678_c0_g1_i1:101-925(+)
MHRSLLLGACWPSTALAVGAQDRQVSSVSENRGVRVLLSVITRNRFWSHALSTLSLLEAILHARDADPLVSFEWHILDDASDRGSAGKKKVAMLEDLVRRGFLANFTQLPKPTGTVRVLRHVVDTFLSRKDFDLFLHSDDDILMGRSTLLRAVHDYTHDLLDGRWHSPSSNKGGGVLALFVNSWLDEQLSHKHPAFGPYAAAPFLGGAAYLTDRRTLEITGNPWALALQKDKRTSPHEAHVPWLLASLAATAVAISRTANLGSIQEAISVPAFG